MKAVILHWLWHGPQTFISLLLQGIIQVYKRVISPFLPKTCRFYPTCSTYSLEAIQRHGPFKGMALSAVRIVKCSPLHPGGYDPVPEHFTFVQKMNHR